jgi:hypothetical protein
MSSGGSRACPFCLRTPSLSRGLCTRPPLRLNTCARRRMGKSHKRVSRSPFRLRTPSLSRGLCTRPPLRRACVLSKQNPRTHLRRRPYSQPRRGCNPQPGRERVIIAQGARKLRNYP